MVTPNAGWAVGKALRSHGSRFGVLAARWNGVIWSKSPILALGEGNSGLNAVDAVTKKDVWAAGSLSPVIGQYEPLIEHYSNREWTRGPRLHPG